MAALWPPRPRGTAAKDTPLVPRGPPRWWAVAPSLLFPFLFLFMMLSVVPRPSSLFIPLPAAAAPTGAMMPRPLTRVPLSAQSGWSGRVRRDPVGTGWNRQPSRRPPPDNDDGDDEWEEVVAEDLGEPLPPNMRPDLKTLTDPNVDPKVLAAVERLGGKVTIADVAAASGLSLAATGNQLRDLAYLTGASILVTTEGELLYNFGPGVSTRLAASSLRAKLAQSYEAAAPFLQKAARVTFGVALFASLFIIFTSITLLQSQSRDSRDDRRDDGGGFFPQRLWWGPDIWIIPDPYYGSNVRRREEMSFIESIYSFVFGDGDPNHNLEERRYRQIASVIRGSGGAVTAEQLAPYLDPPAGWSERETSAVVDEAFVAPALTRFNGRAEVTDRGDIVYVFDDLRPTTGGRAAPSPSSPVPEALSEQEVPFSRAPTTNLFIAAGLGLFNLFGALQLGSLLGSIGAARTLGPFLDAVRIGYPALLLYALVYAAAPAWRWIRLQAVNAGIAERNARRAEAAQELANPPRPVVQKLAAAREYQRQLSPITAKDATYRTDRPAPARDPFADFDRKLSDR